MVSHHIDPQDPSILEQACYFNIRPILLCLNHLFLQIYRKLRTTIQQHIKLYRAKPLFCCKHALKTIRDAVLHTQYSRLPRSARFYDVYSFVCYIFEWFLMLQIISISHGKWRRVYRCPALCGSSEGCKGSNIPYSVLHHLRCLRISSPAKMHIHSAIHESTIKPRARKHRNDAPVL